MKDSKIDNSYIAPKDYDLNMFVPRYKHVGNVYMEFAFYLDAFLTMNSERVVLYL